MPPLLERQERLLKLIIENYIDTAEPVGSNFLVTTAGLELSGATVRNEMRDLEEAGFLTHPHTSAGRIPTEAGYRYYVEHLMKPVNVKKKFQMSVEKILANKHDRNAKQKEVGKAVAGFIENAVIISTNRDTIYYTGLSYLFAQPEFHDAAVTVSISTIFDNCEDRLDDMYTAVEPGETKILIGSDNPFGSNCSTVVVRDSRDNLFVILGPLRMDYGEHLGIMSFIRELI